MMRKQLLLICSALLTAIVVGQETPCRHCFGFEEKDVESTYMGVGEVVTAAPVIEEESEPEEPPTIEAEPKDETISAPSNSRSSDSGNDSGLHTPVIVGLSVGGALLLVGAVVMRRRKLNAESSDISAIDSTQPSGDNTV